MLTWRPIKVPIAIFQDQDFGKRTGVVGQLFCILKIGFICGVHKNSCLNVASNYFSLD